MKHFSLHEFVRSETARAKGIDNTPTKEAEANIKALVDNVLDPLREAWGGPITVTSGYRCPELNKAVGGVSTSMHTQGRAADITTGNTLNNRRLYQLVQNLMLPFFELIGNKYDFKWLHISYAPARERRNPS